MKPSYHIYRVLLIVLAAGLIVLTTVNISCAAQPLQSSVLDKGPVIHYLNAPKQVIPSGESEVICVASDKSDDKLTYTWAFSGGQAKSKKEPDVLVWKAPDTIGNNTISVTVSNSRGEKTTRSVTVNVTTQPLVYPEISRVMCSTCPTGEVSRNGQYTLKCDARDSGNSPLRYTWITNLGRIKPGEVMPGSAYAEWFTGAQYGSALITVKVTNSKELEAEAYLAIVVSCCK
jgi:hypothetical protein